MLRRGPQPSAGGPRGDEFHAADIDGTQPDRDRPAQPTNRRGPLRCLEQLGRDLGVHERQLDDNHGATRRGSVAPLGLRCGQSRIADQATRQPGYIIGGIGPVDPTLEDPTPSVCVHDPGLMSETPPGSMASGDHSRQRSGHPGRSVGHVDVTRAGREPRGDLIEDITASLRELAAVDLGKHEVDSGRLLASVGVHVT